MDKEAFFQELAAFAASVHQITTDITKDVRSQSVTPRGTGASNTYN